VTIVFLIARNQSLLTADVSKDKRTIELQTAYVYRKASQRLPHYSGIIQAEFVQSKGTKTSRKEKRLKN